MKIGTIAFLVIGVMIVNPKLEAPAFSQFIGGGGPIIPGPAVPVRLHHHRVRRDLRVPLADLDRHDVEDGRQGEATSGRSATAAMLFEGVVGVMALITAAALHPGDYFAINTSPAVFADARHADRQPAGPAGAGRRNRHRPHGRRRLAGRRHGADLQRAARHARPDGLLVSLRHHVRGGVHPDDDRLGHARSAASCCRSSAAASGSRSADTDWLPGAILATRCDGARLGLLHLDRQHQHDLADVRHRQPAARRGRARRRHDDHHQPGAREVRVGDVRPAVLGSARRR